MPDITHDFSGRVALVTGAASGVGLATAKLLLDAGARVALLDLKQDQLEAAQSELDHDALLCAVDVTQSAAVNAAVTATEAAYGRLDILVNSAGIAGASLRTLDVSDEEWERVMAINSSGTFYCMRAALAGMVERGYGRIVNVASVAGKEGNPMACAYSASKAAVIGMTKSVGKDVAGSGVLVNCITPAPIDTPMVRGLSDEHVQYMLSRVPMGRLATVEEAAMLIAYLASDGMTFSTGATFDLSGGRLTY